MSEAKPHQCFWCPWDCPSLEMAACREISDTDGEPLSRSVPGLGASDCEPAWHREQAARGKLRRTTDVLRDLADYAPPMQPTAEAVDGP